MLSFSRKPLQTFVYVKFWLVLSKNVGFICSYENLLKMIKNIFYFNFNFFLFSRYLKFCPDRFSHVVKQLDGKAIRLILKFMMSSTVKQTITIHIFSNISRCKDNQTMKFGELIEYNVRNIFLQKSCKKWDLFLFFLYVLFGVKASGQLWMLKFCKSRNFYHVLYSCYMKFYFCYIFHIYVTCFIIYLLHICMYSIYNFNFVIHFYFNIIWLQIYVITLLFSLYVQNGYNVKFIL